MIVEAAQRSGSLITARFALEQGREVFAVPGSPLDPRAEGTNDLLKQGATLVTEAADVIAALQPILGQRREPPSRDVADAAMSRASPTPTRARASWRCSARRRSAWTIWCGSPDRRAALVRTVLLELELAGRLERRGGSVALIGHRTAGQETRRASQSGRH